MRSVWASLPQHLWLFLAMFFLEAVGEEDLLFDPDWGFDSYEITIPKVLSFRKGAPGADASLSYLLQIEGKEHVVHLRPKKLLLPRHLPVFSFTQEGSLIEDYPHIPDQCNYVGSVEGSQESESTLSTCMGGLRGVLNIDSRYYQIEPLRASSSFEHVVYLVTEDNFNNETCGVVDEETGRPTAEEEEMARISTFHQSYKHQRYLELVMVFDLSRFVFTHRNMSRMVDDAILLASIADTYFLDLSLKIQLKALEVWTQYNRIQLYYPNLSEVLGQFVLYKRASLHHRLPADWVHLYIARRYRDATAWSWGRACEEHHAGSASSFLNVNILGPATWTAHEMGHCVGMMHDEEFCQCRGRKSCVMGTGRTGFSNCSYHQYFLHASYKMSYCLSDIPQLHIVERCGNKIVENQEQCDCGSKEDCKEDLCCGPDCKWKEGVNCSTGLCCHKCNFLPSGYVCRKEVNECDLAEYCDGTSGFCPDDYYKQDGTPCRYGGFCFHKGCRSRYLQCQAIFGRRAKEAPHQCYEAVNMLGDQSGNCGIVNATRYTRCHRGNTICGRLQCINVKTLSKFPDHTIILSTYLRRDDLICWGTSYHGTMIPHGVPDIGDINDGTSCGHNRVCLNRTCVDYTTLKFDCLPGKCNSRGVCNNRKNCHCTYGWDPPFCVEVGYGGSLDSGPPGPRTEVFSTFHVLYILRIILFFGSMIIMGFGRMMKNLFRNRRQKKPPETQGKKR
ncbi:disintegrin and metalloproteinase domain-containing protein 30 [Apodemus sylvaticus]|uniref:disintegrin and metalloproteinase domain-containing protein 30 n=1 Tax=Apodemus sylvaticus TaxID=10129 RepID=UPI0022444CED|nr:disintegrin and metalloproteinase domain-containing protein 30 [Apodemus sylvaticus]